MLARFMRPASARLISPSIPCLVRPMSSLTPKSYEHILVSSPRSGVGQITLNRPKVNALNTPLMSELNDALRAFDDSKATGAIVITGSERAFAAGADIKEMQNLTFSEAYRKDFIKLWSDVTQITKPVIAAVNGHALGGGCELAMMADIIYCGPTATFGQPEIKLGVIPGAGGSQRLVKAIGKAKAMELILTGKTFSAEEAERWGLAARVFETPEKCVEGALETAETISGYGALAVKAAKEVVNQSYEVGLSEGVKYERRVFHALFSTKDQKTGMAAFVNRTKPEWTGE
ncbi:ECH-domain-containing protein [Tuber magnatum]|uniref:Probable enoyl-CoA hydratase, mitochondrial n=1 Tax=Tuber magnatum TaxID=42249 RepID=A0A317SQZ6_9PEZI|nr:ECH-domain-containing protein [Tuber magnatum]